MGPRARSAWCSTPTCPGSPATAPGRSARTGSTRPGRTRTCPCVDVLTRLADRGQRDLLTLGVTPVLAAQLDHPYCLRAMHAWLADWQLRAHATHRRPARASARPASTGRPPRPWRPSSALAPRGVAGVPRPGRRAAWWSCSAGPRRTRSARCCPAASGASCSSGGLRDTTRCARHAARGDLGPECGYAPGMEHDYAAAGVRRFLVDGPALRGDTAAGRTRSDGTDVVAFGRDLEVTYRVWSPRAGYPGGPDYRDFHTFDHASGFKPFRVTGQAGRRTRRPTTPSGRRPRCERDAEDFVGTVVERLRGIRGAPRSARPRRRRVRHRALRALVARGAGVAGGGPDACCRRPGCTSRRCAAPSRPGTSAEPVVLPASSWGSGKDWRVWDGAAVCRHGRRQRRRGPPAARGRRRRPEAAPGATRPSTPWPCRPRWRSPATGRSWSPRTPRRTTPDAGPRSTATGSAS